MSKLIYRVEYDCEGGTPVGMFLAEYHTSNESVKTLCRKYRSRAPFMPEPEHPSFSSGIPYCISFGCESPQQLMKWFGYSKTLLREILQEFKIRIYKSYLVYECNEQVGFDLDEATLEKELTFEQFNAILRNRN